MGKYIHDGKTQKYYDKHYNYIGKSAKDGTTEKYYGSHGHYQKKRREVNKFLNVLIYSMIIFLFPAICFSEKLDSKVRNKIFLQKDCNDSFGLCVTFPSNFKIYPSQDNGDGMKIYYDKGF